MNPSSVTFGDTSSSEEVNTFGEISMNIDEIKLLDIQPSQFYISEEKLSGVKSWFDPNDLSNFEPLPIFEHGGKIFFTDGHTRALAAFLSGIEKVPLVWDSEEEIGIKEYEICVKACENRGIKISVTLRIVFYPMMNMLQNGITGVTVCRKLYYILMKNNIGGSKPRPTIVFIKKRFILWKNILQENMTLR